MGDFSALVQAGSYHAWLFIPSAILIGALHGLEPGHSKTMMAAFIVAIRGTIWQAVLLGVSAAFSHSLVIWGLAAAGLMYGQQLNAEGVEPYFQIVSGVIIIITALWMARRTYRDVQAEAAHHHGHEHHHGHSHSHGHSHDHSRDGDHGHHGHGGHYDEDARIKGPHGGFLIDTGHGKVELSVFETGVPPRFEVRFLDGGNREIAPWKDTVVTVETIRPDGATQQFAFMQKDNMLFSTSDIAEPHEFTARLSLDHGGHAHTYAVPFREDDHVHPELIGLSGAEYQDAHERQHAMEIERRFATRKATTGQIVLFGLSGGLLPCPAALTVLLLCLQLKKFTLGFTLVLSFSAGLALTLVSTGAIAAWGVRHASKRIAGFSKIARRVPYFSSALISILGLYMIYSGFHGLK